MGAMSIWHWMIVLVVVLVLFGKGRVSDIMGEFGKGIKSFKEGMDDGAKSPLTPPQAQIPAQPTPPAPAEKQAEQTPPAQH